MPKSKRLNSKSVFALATVSDVLRLAGHEVPNDVVRREGHEAGRLIKCPLHEDGTPSFRIFPGGFRCFGCNVSGNISDLIIALHRARNRAEAARWLERNL
jgi:hypothetical protein